MSECGKRDAGPDSVSPPDGKDPATKGKHERQGPEHTATDIRVRNMRGEGMQAQEEETVTGRPTELRKL